MFIGRRNELDDLRTEFDQRHPSLVIMYGRRRIGKSTLIQEAAQDRPFIYFQATRDLPQANLSAFKVAAVDAIGDDGILANLNDWFGVLNHLAHAAERLPRLIVTIDEFPYLCEGDKALPSVFQKFIDSGAPRRGDLKIVLCGSTIAHMEELLAERNPLYGRQTGIYDIGPLPLRDAAEFLPGYSAEDAIAAYAIFGGVPYYLEAMDPNASLARNVIDTLLSRRSKLGEEPANLLRSETPGSPRFFGILHAIADGCTKSGDIKNRVGEGGDNRNIGWYLDRLRAIRIVRAERSLDATERERDRRYVIDDPLTAFWFRFVRPNLSAIGRGFGEAVYRDRLAPALSDYLGGAFEEICRDHVRHWAQEFLPSPANTVGKVWSDTYDLDVAGELIDGSVVFGECKWRNQEMDVGVLEHLVDCAGRTRFGQGAPGRHFILFSKAGFSAALQRRAASDASVHLLSLNDVARWDDRPVPTSVPAI